MGTEVFGFVFMCSDDTYRECVGRRLFGMPKQHLKVVELIKKGTVLFLYNFQKKELYGVFQAQGNGKFMLNRDAWVNVAGNTKRESPYPAQVTVSQLQECTPLSESEFMPVLMKNRRKKFKHRLSKVQLQELLGLFQRKIKGNGSYPESLTNLMPQPVNNATHQQQANSQGFDLSQQQEQARANIQEKKIMQQKVDTLQHRVESLQSENVDLQQRMNHLEQQVDELRFTLGKRTGADLDGDVIYDAQNQGQPQEYVQGFANDGPGFKFWPDNNQSQVQNVSSKRIKMGGGVDVSQNSPQSGCEFNVCQPEQTRWEHAQPVNEQQLVHVNQYYSFSTPQLEDSMKNMKIAGTP
eukprot:TRINITY_DN35218_c0_g1_i1.p1 TRINITY_DN35218_c0_g1~~TRINITY_DN35218_c0_g1_i1.p1  ORF type:complete len:367 (+),score=35.78 TRINITY_DN35218_c0_g1_i1:47-1102(+)